MFLMKWCTCVCVQRFDRYQFGSLKGDIPMIDRVASIIKLLPTYQPS
jgi:hypothetical protein